MFRPQLTIALTVGLLTGCSTFDLRKNIPWGAGEEGKLERPMKLVANWSETVMTSGNAPPMRGFGGRLVFYAHEGGKPVKVAGTLSVYAFDESQGLKDDVVPERKFVFTEEQFAQHYSDKGMLKHSFSFWLPWDELGGEKKEVSLLCRFVSAQGDVVVSEQTRHVLPGKPPKKPEIPETLAADHPSLPQPPQPASQIQQVSYFEPQNAAPTETRPRMTTSTISLEDASPALLPQANIRNIRGLEESPAGEWSTDLQDAAGNYYQGPGQNQFSQTATVPWAGPQAAAQQPSAHSSPERSQAPRASAAPPTRGRGLWQRPRVGSQSGLAIQRSEGRETRSASTRGSLFPPRP